MKALALPLGVILALLMPGSAGAFYGNGAELLSADEQRLEQGDDASTAPAISADGRFVAFETRAGNFFADDDPDPPGRFRRGGIFRRELSSGRLELVADANFFDETDPAGPPVLQGAHNPSISGDGRFVVFSTAQKLTPADLNDNVDVYRRDMTLPVRAPGAFALISARDGSDVPASYGSPALVRPGRNPGSDVWPLEAISADGNRVVFRTSEVSSDLPSSASATSTPAGQLLVREIGSRRTRLITRRSDDPSQPAGGADGPGGISDDGSTVVWTGTNARFQTKFFDGEPTSTFILYYLWQRIDDGPTAPTRRVTGATDPDDPSCPPNASVPPVQTATGPCYGPLTGGENSRSDISTRLPAMSADGRRVAFLVSAGPRPNDQTGNGLDVWVTDMSPGVSRKAGSRELTREGAPNDARAGGQIDGVAMSPSGRLVALTTTRASFVLPAPRPIGEFRTLATERDVALIDLGGDTIERVTRAYDGRDAAGSSAAGTSVTDDGRVAFSSTAPNFFFGDANEHADVFLATRVPEPRPEPPPVEPDSQAPVVTDQTPPPAPRLAIRQKRLRNGTVQLTVRSPLSGSLQAVVSGRVRATRSKRTPPMRTLARARKDTERPGTVVLTLKLRRAYRKVLARKLKLRSTAKVTLAPQLGGKALERNLAIVFTLPKKRKK